MQHLQQRDDTFPYVNVEETDPAEEIPHSHPDAAQDEKTAWITGTIIVALLCIGVGCFVYFTQRSTDPIDLGVQTPQMQQANYCADRCCTGNTIARPGKKNFIQRALLVMQLIQDRDCVVCPNRLNLKRADCVSTTPPPTTPSPP